MRVKVYNDMMNDRLITEEQFRAMAQGYIRGLQARGEIDLPDVAEVMENTDEVVFIGYLTI